MGTRSIAKILIVHQLQKISILSRRNDIPRLYCLSSRHPNKKKAN